MFKPSIKTLLERQYSRHTATRVQHGHSGAEVWRLEHKEERLFLKVAPRSNDPGFSLRDEVEKLRWMLARGLPVPEVLDFFEQGGAEWMLTRALEGQDAALTSLEPAWVTHVLAGALRLLHTTSLENCPFDQRLDLKLEGARVRLEAGAVDTEDFDAENLGQDPQKLYQTLFERRPFQEDLVFCHGDYCLPNIVLLESGAPLGTLSGFVDVGRAGIADRYQDLALVTRSLEGHHNPCFHGLSVLFLERYGLEHLEQDKLEYYRLLDEFF